MRLEFHPQAELELIEAAVHYGLQVPGLGGRFESEVRRATDLLLEHLEIGHSADPDLRQFVLHRFPFTLFYSVTSDVLRIEVVAYRATGGRELTANLYMVPPCQGAKQDRKARHENQEITERVSKILADIATDEAANKTMEQTR